MIGRMADNMRKTGIDIIGDVPWGTHFCQFYQTKEDLTDILVPYFKTGLESNEFCMWITSAPLTVEETRNAMKKEVSDFELYANKGQIEIISHTEWYLKDGVFNLQRVLNGWVDKLNRALARGYEGMRITGNTAWLEKNDWRNFAHYEEGIDNVIGKYNIMAICSYSLDTCGAYEIIDVVRNHQFALIKREGRLELFESSERRRAREAIRKSEEKYRILYETIKDGIVATDMDGHILECNQAYVDMFGYSKDEIIKLTYHQITPEKWRRMESRVVKELIIGRGYSDEYEKEYRRKDGTVFPISIRVWLIKDEYGKPKGMWGIIRDITEHKRMEESLRKLSNAIEQSPCSIIITDTKGDIEYVNPKFCKTTGYTPEEAIGQNPRMLKSGDKPPEEYKCLWDTITSGNEWRGEFHNKKKCGEFYWEYAFISPIRNSEGVITHFLAVKEDITERKRMEEEIKNVAKFPAENPYPVLRVTHDGVILYANSCSASLLHGWNCEVGQFLPDSLRKLVSDAFCTRSIKNGVETKYRDQTFSFTIVPVVDTAYVNLYGVDVTERKHAEDELRKQRDYLEYLTRQLTTANKELEAFCYSVSHDLRAPLRSIDGFSKVLMEDYADKLDAQAKKHLQRVCAASLHMGQLIDDLLNLSRITRREIRFIPVNLSELVRSITNELQEMQPERKVEFIIANGLVTRGDSNLLRIAFKNLLSNAWKFTRNLQQARIEFGITQGNEKSAYFVRDNGVGFDMAYVNKLFGAFQRLHMATEFEGTGIGLAIVQRIIHRHGGHIWAEGEVDRGAVFYFTI